MITQKVDRNGKSIELFVDERRRKYYGKALLLILNITLSIMAFSFLVSLSADVVSADVLLPDGTSVPEDYYRAVYGDEFFNTRVGETSVLTETDKAILAETGELPAGSGGGLTETELAITREELGLSPPSYTQGAPTGQAQPAVGTGGGSVVDTAAVDAATADFEAAEQAFAQAVGKETAAQTVASGAEKAAEDAALKAAADTSQAAQEALKQAQAELAEAKKALTEAQQARQTAQQTVQQATQKTVEETTKQLNGLLGKETTLTYNGQTLSGVVGKDASGNYILTAKDGTVTQLDPSKVQLQQTGGSGDFLQGVKDVVSVLFNDALVGSLLWGAVVGGIVYLGANLLGADSNQAQALGIATFAGVATLNFAYRYLVGKTIFGGEAVKTLFFIDSSSFPGFGSFAQSATGVGVFSFVAAIGVGIAVYAALYKKESKKVVTFSCEPWEAPTKGEDCEKCNKDSFKPCSEYRCKSLGQACQLLNAGTGNETCTWVNPKDVSSPGIAPWNSVLTKDHKYTDVRIRPPGSGVEPGRMRIEGGAEGGCVKAFTPLQFGITTTEPAQCKIDYNHTKDFESMAFFMGGTNLFLYNHSERLSLPGPKNLEIVAPELKNDGTYTLYARCKDANGNENVDEFAVRFCVEKGPDTTPARVEATGIQNGAPIGFNTRSVNLDFYLNEPAECKWSREDKDYSNMENNAQCSTQIFEMNANLLYPCKANLTGVLDRQTNDFYLRCKDQPGAAERERNVNTESFKFTLRGTEPLKISDIKPNGTIEGAGDFVTVFIEVETVFGEHEGDATCFYSTTGIDKDFIKFFETGTNRHRQRQDLAAGKYKYFVRCIDLGGNTDSNISEFTVFIDRIPPIITRAYQDNQLLKILTNEKSSCSYSQKDCRFQIANGVEMPYANTTEHFAEWKTDSSYYIRCADASGNEPLPDSCSIIVRAYGKV